MIDSPEPEHFSCCFSDKASSHLQPIKDVLSLLYSFELFFRFKTPCKWNEWNESVNGVSWEAWFDLRQGAIAPTFMANKKIPPTFLRSAFQASQLSRCVTGSNELKNMALVSYLLFL